MCNAQIFNQWLEEFLCPVLHDNHVVLMDNASFHKSNKTQELIEQAGGTLLFLPPYSSDFNPIEHNFAAIRKIREFHEHETIDSIIKNYN